MKNNLANDTVMIFDMDGTLFQTELVLEAALEATFEQLRQINLYHGDTPVEEYLKIIGATMPEVWRTLLPGLEEHYEEIENLFFQKLNEEIGNGSGALFPHTEETLKSLHNRGVKMFVASNGLQSYVEAICEYYKLDNYFVDYYTPDKYGAISKKELVKGLCDDYNIQKGYMVGDRKSDIVAGKENQLLTVGCHYGFANEEELKKSDYIIKNLIEIDKIYKEL